MNFIIIMVKLEYGKIVMVIGMKEIIILMIIKLLFINITNL